MELSFGEQIKIILKRKNMTIQDLALLYEQQTGVKMTRQNLSQRLRRDNFPEQDMHLLASMLGYQVSVQLTPKTSVSQPPIFEASSAVNRAEVQPEVRKVVTADGSTVHVPEIFKKPQAVQGEINPLTGQEYLTNTVRTHPELSGYVQVYDRSTHEWNDVNETFFWEFQASKKQLLGSDYQEPILI